MFVSSTKLCSYRSSRLAFIACANPQFLTPNSWLHNVEKSSFLRLENRYLRCSARDYTLGSCDVKRKLVLFHAPYAYTYKTAQKYFPLGSLCSRTYCIDESKRNEPEQPEKQSLIKRFKSMYRDYWYVLVPVHLITSICWFGGFYYMAKSGVDVVALLESMGFSEKIVSHLKETNAGYVALAYALYKIATPVRYTVTLGGTTISIKYLKEWGYIKPIQSPAQLKKMYTDKKDQIREKAQETLKNVMKRDSEQESSKKATEK